MVDVKREPLDVPGLQRELLDYQAPYGRSSEQILRACSRGEMPKPPNYTRWSFVYAVLRRLGRVPA
jgi:hypothetical protein